MNYIKEELTFECSEVLSTSMDEEKKLVLSEDEIKKLRLAMEKLDEFQEQCQEALEQTLEQHRLDSGKVEMIQWDELAQVLFERAQLDKTDVQRMEEDLNLFQMFKAAIKLVTDSVLDENVQQLSDDLEHWLNAITPVMIRVLWSNGISPPKPPPTEDLQERLNEQIKDSLREFVCENDEENVEHPLKNEEEETDSCKINPRTVRDVRNYITVRDLGDLLLLFKGDFGHVTRHS
ncbi:unnamed protein product [Pocillopora meandrina]|uniref:Uncharacterized protein n=1 Tax=Pocillopora meandrina TaxID=46732 RepID=A0AAU9XSS7_9CNID|nr:unnamed protein product [Pocillopora meandrina]